MKTASLLGLLLSAVAATFAHAADLSQKGTTEFGFSLGIGDNFSTNFKGGTIRDDIKLLSLMFDWGKISEELSRWTLTRRDVSQVLENEKQSEICGVY